jgi:hypothetical protein
MGKNLPPYARRTLSGRFTAWTLDWGNLSNHHHHSTRKRLGSMKPIRKLKALPRGAAGTFTTRLKRWFRR